MNNKTLHIILNDVLNNDINSIKKISLICKNFYNNISIFKTENHIKNKLHILQKYINYPNDCLIEASNDGYIDIVRLMIKKGTNRFFWPITCAARRGHINIVKLILETGYDNVYWAIDHAKRNNHTNIVELLDKYNLH
jgi:hypothetical protein